MWEALQTDLVDFVSTIQSDTSKVISSGAEELDDQDRPQDEEQLRAKKVVDLKRSSKTFELPVEKEYVKSFDKFMESFSMSLYNEQISALLDEEVGFGVLMGGGVDKFRSSELVYCLTILYSAEYFTVL